MHLEVIFELLMCGFDAEITPAVCTSGLEIEFYPNLTQNKLSSPSRSGKTFPFVCNRQKLCRCFFGVDGG